MGLCFSFPSGYAPLASSSSSSLNKHLLNQYSDRGECSEIVSGSHDGESPNLKVFSLAELKSAKKRFRDDTLLGEGGSGKVYKGWLDEKTLTPAKAGKGMMVAIKKLNYLSSQGFQELQTDVKFVGRLSHPNLVKLLGYCFDDEELFLVYEFMPNGSLVNHLLRRNPNIEPLSWNTRIKIAIGAARALVFLHTSEMKVIYGQFKTSHILLDEHYNAKISDFIGLDKLRRSDERLYFTKYLSGYAAPEYGGLGVLLRKSDVYGFGVVLLELLSGMWDSDIEGPTEDQNIVEWLKPLLSDKNKLKGFMDHRIEGQYAEKASIWAAQLALKCVEWDPKHRPSMKEVVKALEAIEALKLPNKEI